MSEAELELRAARGDAAAAAEPDAQTDAAEALDRAEPEARETQPMTAAAPEPGEKNGAVKLKIPEEEEEGEEHFTGLNKEELLRVASSPGWVRTRWTLLVLFWLAWLGMLVGAVLIILQAPACRDLPALSWWNHGPLYRVRTVQDSGLAQDSGSVQDIRGVEQQVERLVQMKVQGLVLGPVHVAPKDQPMALVFEEVTSELGTVEQVRSLLMTAHKRGLYVVLDLTPNYQSLTAPWFSNTSAEVTSITERLKSALVFWLTLGVDGVMLDAVDTVSSLVPSQWSDIRAIVQNWTDYRPHKRLLMGGTGMSSPLDVSVLLGDSGVDLLLSPVLSETDSTERAQSIQLLYSAHNQTNLLWSLEPSPADPAPSTGGSSGDCVQDKLDLMLLLTLPGTALIQSDLLLTQSDRQELNNTQQQEVVPAPCEVFLSSLSSLRAKVRPLLFGDFSMVYNSSWVLVYNRTWDQTPGFLTIINSSPDQSFSAQVLEGLKGSRVKVVLSTNTSALSPDSDLSLDQVLLGPKQAALLRLDHS